MQACQQATPRVRTCVRLETYSQPHRFPPCSTISSATAKLGKDMSASEIHGTHLQYQCMQAGSCEKGAVLIGL